MSAKGPVLLVLTENIEGKIFVHDADGHLVVELTKPAGRSIELGLEEGKYRVINLQADHVFEATIVLDTGAQFVLKPEMLESTDTTYTTPRGAREEKLQRDTVLQGKPTYHLFGEFTTLSTSINGEYGLLMGGIVGVTVNRIFSVGAGGFGKANYDPGLPGYGGLFLAYNFSPERKLHFRMSFLLGAGTSTFGTVYYVFEPGVDVVLNLSRIVRIWAGLSYPLVDKPNSGFDSPVLGLGFQFGK